MQKANGTKRPVNQASPPPPPEQTLADTCMLFVEYGGGPFVRVYLKEQQIFFPGKNNFSGQNRIFDPFSRVSGPGRCPKRSGTSFSSILHPSMLQNLFPGPFFAQTCQFIKSPTFPPVFLHLPLTILPFPPLSSKLPSFSPIPSPRYPPSLKKKSSHHQFFFFFSPFHFLTNPAIKNWNWPRRKSFRRAGNNL